MAQDNEDEILEDLEEGDDLNDDEGDDDDQDLKDDLKDVKVEDIDAMDEAKAKEIAKKALTMKQKFYSRATDTSKKFKEYKTKNPPKAENPANKPNRKDQPKEKDDAAKRIEALEISDKKRQFGYENNLSPEETDTIFKMTNNNPTKKDLENPFFKGGLKALRSQKRIQDNTPENGQTFSVGGKTWAQMSPEEKKANFPEYMKSKKKA